MKRKEGGGDLLQSEATYKAEIINTAGYWDTRYTEDQFVNIVTSYESRQPNMNSTMAADVTENKPTKLEQ